MAIAVNDGSVNRNEVGVKILQCGGGHEMVESIYAYKRSNSRWL